MTVDFVVLTAAIVGLGTASYNVVSDGVSTQSSALDTQLKTDQISTSFGAAGSDVASAQPEPSSVCTPDGGHCAYDHDGDGMVDELRNYSRGKTLDVEGNGLTMQGYADSGWS
ncbi:MAG: hypothetical protein QNJ03_02020 [Dinoroseobacter sp.]|nr:hypothetical protein [Dinoroseobacter sp.]